MDVLVRIRAGDREVECGLATTKRERAAVLAQRFRVYRRRAYYRPDLRADRDTYDARAVYFLATFPDGADGRFLLGSARLILGESRNGFRFPVDEAFEFDLPAAIRETTIAQRVEVTRVVAEAAQGIVVGGLLTPLGLIQAIAQYVRPLDIRCGLAVIKQRFFRALRGLGVRLHEIEPARLIYPKDGATAAYYHQHPDPVVPVYWLVDEIAPSVAQAIALYDCRYTTPSRVHSPPSSSPGAAEAESARHDSAPQRATDRDGGEVPRALDAAAEAESPHPFSADGAVHEPRRVP